MATRSQIGILHADGTIHAHYCHSDGYFSWMAPRLVKHYTNPKTVQKLIDLGVMSILNETIGKKHDYSWRQKVETHEEREADPRNKMCDFMGRDRGDKDVGPIKHADLEAFADHFEEYAYLWVEAGGYWIGSYTNTDADELAWYRLTDMGSEGEIGDAKPIEFPEPDAGVVAAQIEAAAIADGVDLEQQAAIHQIAGF